MNRSARPATRLLWILVAVLLLVHQDFWFWDSGRLVLGFLPIGLFYHMLFSVAAALLWAGAIRYAWPSHLEAIARRKGDRL